MKKLLIPALAALLFAAVSCTSVEDQAKEYAHKLVAPVSLNQTTQIIEIQTEAQEWMQSLSPEDKALAAEAYLNEIEKLAQSNYSFKVKMGM